MSSFFTLPASQRKRKGTGSETVSSIKRRKTGIKDGSKREKSKPPRAGRDESISSGSGSEDGRRKASDEEIGESGSESEDETGADRRRRLAEQYLQNLKGEVEDEVGFDAEAIDRDLIAERLQEDVAETKGRLYRYISSTFDFTAATKTQFRANTLSTTSIAACPPYAYTVTKDIQLTKWELSTPSLTSHTQLPDNFEQPRKKPRPISRRPTRSKTTKGNRKKSTDFSYQHHTAPILCVAASDTGKFVATGGADKKLIIWSAETLEPLRVFTQHRDAVTSLAFRRGTNQLYSSSKDRTIKTWSLDELAYVETLFGHQDEVLDVAALAAERCVSVGARDRTARLWKVVEETQLVFRGGGSSEKRRSRPTQDQGPENTSSEPNSYYAEGSIDRITLIDEETFVTGSDNGSLSLWTLTKKKPIFTVPLAHGLDPPLNPEEVSAEAVLSGKVPDRQPRWITALATVPYSDLILSGSSDGVVRAWGVSADKKRIESRGCVREAEESSANAEKQNQNQKEKERDLANAVKSIETPNSENHRSIKGIINDLSVFERGERGKDGLCICVAYGTEHRLGRWKTVQGRNGAVVFEVPKMMVEKTAVVAGDAADDGAKEGEGDGAVEEIGGDVQGS